MSEKVAPEIEALLQEHRSFAPADEFRAAAHVSDPAVYAKAAHDPEAFWASFAEELEWIEPWSKVLEWHPPDAKWFLGGKLRSSGKASPATAAR
jgi:acetyl-CoA synthetase